jgi:glycosyltransferase involved in cell wall biosynthesis
MGRPLRVLLGMPFGSIQGGAERIMDDFVRRAGEVDVEPHVVFFEEGPWPEDLRARGVPVTVVDPGRFRQVHRGASALVRLRTLIRREQPDVVLGWLARAHVVLAPAATAAGMRGRLVWFQQLVTGDFVERLATVMPAQLVLACSRASGEAQQLLRPRRPVHLAYPGIEPPELLGAGELADLRAQVALPEGRTVLGISGRLVRWKRQDALLRAVALLAADGREVHALVVGGDNHNESPGYGDELRALAESLGVADRVTFTGHRTDAVALTQLMDVMVNASDPEPFGLVLLEALAVRRPVVALARGGPAEIVEDGVTGALVRNPQPEGLAAGLRPLVDDPGLRARMGEAGRERVLSRFTVERFVQAVRAGLDRVVSGDRAAR